MRTSEIRADLMSLSTGTGRYRTDPDRLLELVVPWMDRPRREKIASDFMTAWKLEDEIARLQQEAAATIAELGVDSEDSRNRLAFYKPPK